MTGTINIKITVTGEDNANKIAHVLQNIADKVPEAEFVKLNKIVKDNPNVFKNIISKLNNPIVAKALGI